MFLKKVDGPRAVKLPNGKILSMSDLPDVSTERWVASRKAAVVRGVLYGLLTQEQALKRYNLSADEFQEWLSSMSAHGESALKTTQIKKYRQP